MPLVMLTAMTYEGAGSAAVTGEGCRKPVLVVGGTGHVGASLCQYLSAGGYGVTAASRSTELTFDDPRIGRLRMDVFSPKAVNEFQRYRTAVICPWIEHDDQTTSRQWIDRLARQLVETGARSLIYLSSMWVYGGESQEFLTETTPVAPTSSYGSAHASNEVALVEIAGELGADLTILRMANLVGPDPFYAFRTKTAFAHELLEMALLDRLIMLRSAPSTPRNLLPRSLFHHDVEKLIARPQIEGRVDIFNLGSGSTSTMIGLAREIAAMAERYHGDIVAIEHPEESTPQVSFHLDTGKIRSTVGPCVDDLGTELVMVMGDVLVGRDRANVNENLV